jgi:hypothetical protein
MVAMVYVRIVRVSVNHWLMLMQVTVRLLTRLGFLVVVLVVVVMNVRMVVH